MAKGGLTEKLQIKFLKRIEIFSSLSEEELRKVIQLVRFRAIKKGQTLFNQGDKGQELYVVLSGEIGVSIHINGGENREVATFSTGNFFGEMSIFEHTPRSANAYTKRDTNLLCLNEKALSVLIEKYPYISVLVMRKMLNISNQRLQKTNMFVADIVRWGDEARNRAFTDEFTGAYNRRYFDEVIEEIFSTSKEHGIPFSLVMVDLDFFREINETYSPEVGDVVIQAAAKAFQENLRKTDILVRYGGDEFTFLMPATGSEEAIQITEQIRVAVEKLTVLKRMKGKIKNVTTSQGIATYPENSKELKVLREKADQALYQAKERGRNQVVCAQ